MSATYKARWLFVFAVMMGTLGIGIGTMLSSHLITVGLPLLAMLAYTFMGERLKLTKLIGESFPDSIYYQGFIFTLISLTATLYVYNSASINMDILVSNFALALITSILGLSIRIFYNSFYASDSDYRKSQMTSLEEETRKFIENTNSANLALVVNQKEATESILKTKNEAVEQLESVFKGFENSLNDGMQHFNTACERFSEGTQDMLTQVKEQLISFQMPDDWLIDKLSDPIENFVDRLSVTENLLAELQEQQVRIRDNSSDIATNVTDISDTLNSVTESLSSFNEKVAHNISSLDKLNQNQIAVSEITTKLNHASEQLTNISLPVKNLTDGVNRFNESLETMPELLNQFTDSALPSIAKLASHTDSLNNLSEITGSLSSGASDLPPLIESLKTSMVEIGSLSELLGETSRSVDNFKKLLNEATSPYEKIGENIESHVNLLREHQKEFEQLVKQIQSDTQEVTSFLVDSTRYIVKRLETENA
jgi:chromosome segregation ATPase